MLERLYDQKTYNHHKNAHLEWIILGRKRFGDNERESLPMCRISTKRKIDCEGMNFLLPVDYIQDDDRVPKTNQISIMSE